MPLTDFIRPGISVTGDGSPTLICPCTGQTYHSVNGAVAESMHVFIRNGFELCGKKRVSVLECGFGSGLSAWLTARAALTGCRTVIYTAVELYPVDPSVLSCPGFPEDELFGALHAAPWGVETPVTDRFRITKVRGDLSGTIFDTKFDVVYFDMFAPDTCPELWKPEIFDRIARAMEPGGILVTYSAKGDVKRALRGAGLKVSRLAGAPGKKHMLRAVKVD